jgi:TolB protein
MMKNSHAAALFVAVWLPGLAQAQDLVPVNLYVADLTYAGNSVRVGKPVKITGDRGVSSQPAFTPDGKSVLFIGRRDSANAQSDVYRIDLATGTETRITSTPENENSPTVTPDGNLMVIRWVPATLFTEWGPWIYDMNGKPLRGVLPGPDTVGYYVQIDSVTYAMMRPKSKWTIATFDTRTKQMVDRDTPAATLPPQLIPGQRAVSYSRVDSLGRNQIMRLDPSSGAVTPIAPAVRGRLVHAWTPRGTLIMGKGNAIFVRNPSRDSQWKQVAAFSDPELQNINTYVVSPAGDKLVLISPVKPPLHLALRDSIQAGRSVAAALRAIRAMTPAAAGARYDLSEGALIGLASEQKAGSADAVAILETTAALFPRSHRAQLQLGLALKAAGNGNGAAAALRRSLELNAKSTPAEIRDAERAEQALAKPAG